MKRQMQQQRVQENGRKQNAAIQLKHRSGHAEVGLVKSVIIAKMVFCRHYVREPFPTYYHGILSTFRYETAYCHCCGGARNRFL
ncbi:hypothetical protein [Hymenobacter amundsenii]|uniref:hypothetical protein n=1 Tax=Hymenobacter amundsenii TaxID=2006685 RepID=UPI000F82894E|nr:hypothetical protein [Hymenobacter amundsenii]